MHRLWILSRPSALCWPRRVPAFLLVLFLLPARNATGANLVVWPDGSGEFVTIQAAVTAASEGDVITLARGTFVGAGNRDIVIPQRNLTIIAMSPDEPLDFVIDCQASAAEHHRAFGMAADSAAVRLEGITVTNGYADFGGAVSAGWMARPVLQRCVFWNNTAEYMGGAICMIDASPTIRNCTLVGNSAPYGSATYTEDWGHLTVENSMIVFNLQGQALEGWGQISCCNLFGNEGGDLVGGFASCLGKDGNISADPLFCNRGEGDFRLAADSPCATDSPLNPGCALIGALKVGCGVSPVLRLTWGGGKALYR